MLHTVPDHTVKAFLLSMSTSAPQNSVEGAYVIRIVCSGQIAGNGQCRRVQHIAIYHWSQAPMLRCCAVLGDTLKNSKPRCARIPGVLVILPSLPVSCTTACQVFWADAGSPCKINRFGEKRGNTLQRSTG